MSDGPVSLSEAARRLTDSGDAINRSSLSRYVRQHAVDLRPEQRGRETVVDFGKLVRHRQKNTKVSDARMPAPTSPRPRNAPEPGSSPFAEDIDYGVERAGKTKAERQRIELELGERQGVLTVVREVENAAHAGVGMMRNALANAAGDTSEAIAKALGIEAALVRPYIRAFERLALAAFVRGLTENKVIARESLDQPAHEEADGG